MQTSLLFSKLSLLLPLLLLLLLHGSSLAFSIVDHNRGSSIRSILASHRKIDHQLQTDCREMASKSQCSQKLKCRWCRSMDLDDMCFSKLEARRLPSQVFSCD